MSASKAFLTGIRRVLGSPSLILWVYLTGFLLALPLAMALQGILQESLGSSLVADNLRQGFDMSWYGEFEFEAKGLAATFNPSVTGILPILANLEALVDGDLPGRSNVILLAGGAYLLLWTFFAGGILDRYAHPDAPRLRARFFSHCGEYFFRFARLLVISIALYWAIFRWVAGPLHRWIDRATRDVTSERTMIAYEAAAYAVVLLLMMLTAMALDYARIALVVEKRRSALFAFARGWVFLFTHPLRTAGLYVSLSLAGVALVGLYWGIAPGARQSEWRAIAGAFLLGQLFLIARVVLKLWFLASQTALFQSAPPEAFSAAPLPDKSAETSAPVAAL